MTQLEANIQEQLAAVATSCCFAISLAGPGGSMANGRERCVYVGVSTRDRDGVGAKRERSVMQRHPIDGTLLVRMVRAAEAHTHRPVSHCNACVYAHAHKH